jgi:hypothetical protein
VLVVLAVWRRWPRLGIAATALLVTALALFVQSVPVPAHAYHIRGATYTGLHSGGGRIILTLTADGLGVASIESTNLLEMDLRGRCSAGSLQSRTTSPSGVVSLIQNHVFGVELRGSNDPGFDGLLSYTGRFLAPGRAEGTLRWQEWRASNPGRVCDTGVLTWSAIAF